MEEVIESDKEEYKNLCLRCTEILKVLNNHNSSTEDYEKFTQPNSFFAQMINVQRVNSAQDIDANGKVVRRGILSYLSDILSKVKIGEIVKRPNPATSILEYRVSLIEDPPMPTRRMFVVFSIPDPDDIYGVPLLAGISQDLMTEMNMLYFNANATR